MTAHVNPTQLRVVSTLSVADRLAIVGEEHYAPEIITAYKEQRVALFPPTKLGIWLHERRVPVEVFEFVTGSMFVLMAFGSLLSLMFAAQSLIYDAPTTNVSIMLLLVVAIVVGVVVSMRFARKIYNAYPSYWQRVKWLPPSAEYYSDLQVPEWAERRRQHVSGTFSDLHFEIDIFYQHGRREDPIGYAVDPLTKERCAFVVWNGTEEILPS